MLKHSNRSIMKMRIVVMCGGSGTRLHDYSLPKPLNYIHAKPAISYVLEKAPFQEIDFVVAPHLVPFQFESILRQHFKHKTCRFHYLPYFTRGPVESAWLGTLSFDRAEEPIVFLDNDVVYTFPEAFQYAGTDAFLGYSIDHSGSEAFSFLSLEHGEVKDIQEKKRISDQFGCGVYGFSSLLQFREYAGPLLQTPQSRELYMSMVFARMIENGVRVQGLFFPDPILHIGSLQEVKQSLATLPTPSLRICLDLDNTLVTSPVKEGDYSTVQPIPKMIDLVQKWKAKGHTILIHTARRMQTHKHNVGAAIADCAKITLQTLDKYQIPYDELLFGKPIADVYVDDKALNPYLNPPEAFGFFETPTEEKPVNALSANKFNTIRLEKGSVLKRGPTQFLAGEIYYHLHIPEESAIRTFFPKLMGHTLGPAQSEMRTEYIKGIPFAHLWQSQLLTRTHIDMVLEHVCILHNTVGSDGKPTLDTIQRNYLKKTEERFAQHDEYPFPDREVVQKECMRRLHAYCVPHEMRPAHYIHGDLWFSNVLLTFDNKVKFIDMKGICWKTHTTGGDGLYDYAKFYQSFLGYDAVLQGVYEESQSQRDLRFYYEAKMHEKGIDKDCIHAITFALILGTLPFIADREAKERVWNWARDTFWPRVSHVSQN